MAMSPNRDDRELNKFRPSKIDGKSKVATTSEDGLLAGLSFDEVQVEYPTSILERYLYLLQGDLVATVEVAYSNSSKKFLTNVKRL